jgi:hypothetical protein
MTIACQNKLECLSFESFSGHLNVALYLTLVKNKQCSLFCLQALLTDNRCIRKNFQGQTHECIYFGDEEENFITFSHFVDHINFFFFAILLVLVAGE